MRGPCLVRALRGHHRSTVHRIVSPLSRRPYSGVNACWDGRWSRKRCRCTRRPRADGWASGHRAPCRISLRLLYPGHCVTSIWAGYGRKRERRSLGERSSRPRLDYARTLSGYISRPGGGANLRPCHRSAKRTWPEEGQSRDRLVQQRQWTGRLTRSARRIDMAQVAKQTKGHELPAADIGIQRTPVP